MTMACYPLAAKDKTKKASPQDQISVDGHIATSGAPIVRFIATQHYGRTYVYAERGAGQPTTLVDITKTTQPVVLSQLDAGSLVAVTGTSALTGTAPTAPAAAVSGNIRIMDFSDPANPRVTRQFEGVTAVEHLGNGTILLANGEGIWVLSQHFASDPQEDERYERKVLYGDSAF